MTAFQSDNPIMTANATVTQEDLLELFSPLDVRIDSDGGHWTVCAAEGGKPGAVSYSDQKRNFDLYRGKREDFFRNYFGLIVKRYS